MNKLSRFLTILVSVILMAAFLAAPAGAARDPFRGVWTSTDIDGSSQRLVVAGGRVASYRIFYFDAGATVCGLDPDTGDILYAAVARGSLTLSGNAISGDLPVTCLSRPRNNIGSYSFTYIYDPATHTLTDSIGVIWSRR
jgi:hypothetical protein